MLTCMRSIARQINSHGPGEVPYLVDREAPAAFTTNAERTPSRRNIGRVTVTLEKCEEYGTTASWRRREWSGRRCRHPRRVPSCTPVFVPSEGARVILMTYDRAPIMNGMNVGDRAVDDRRVMASPICTSVAKKSGCMQ